MTDVGRELLLENGGKEDEHHDVAVLDVRSDVRALRRRHDVRHQAMQLLRAQTANHLIEKASMFPSSNDDFIERRKRV